MMLESKGSGAAHSSGDWRASLRSLRTRALRRAVPHGRRAQVRAQLSRATWRLYAGSSVSCNCCGGGFRRFRVYVSDGGHRSLTCPRCNSLGRHRVDWLYLIDHTEMLQRPTRLLHIAPEVCLEAPLRRMAHVDYLSADYDSTLAMERLDVRNIHHGDESFDAVICNHVLQLVDDDRVAMSELCRILRPGGWALIQSSVDEQRDDTIEKSVARDSAEGCGRYEEVFQRIYGRGDYLRRLGQAGFTVTISDFARKLPPAVQQRLGLDLDEIVYFCRKPSSVGVAGS